MTVQEMFDQLKKIIDAGNGDAEMYICDTRSGIDEEFDGIGDVEGEILLADDTRLEKSVAIFLG